MNDLAEAIDAPAADRHSDLIARSQSDAVAQTTPFLFNSQGHVDGGRDREPLLHHPEGGELDGIHAKAAHDRRDRHLSCTSRPVRPSSWEALSQASSITQTNTSPGPCTPTT